MGTKTIGVREEVYERLRARKRDDESFTDLLDRLIDESGGDWREGFGSVFPDEADALREATAASRTRLDESTADRQDAAIDRLANAAEDDTEDTRSSDDADIDGPSGDAGGPA